MNLPVDFVGSLELAFGARFTTNPAVREHHGRDESAYAAMPPGCGRIRPGHRRGGGPVVKACAAHRMPLIAFGAGSSLEGQVLAPRGGVCVDLSRMQSIVAIHEQDLTRHRRGRRDAAPAQCGAARLGLFFPIDPGADATIGGMVATRASGTNALRYGTMRENVLALTVVNAQGTVLRTARRAKKSAAGYDLTRLFIGSEGTLGIVTEITLRLAPQPEAIAAAVCHFPSVDAAVRTTMAIIQSGVAVARCELLDAAPCAPSTPTASSRCARRRCCCSNFTAPRRAWRSIRARCRRSRASTGGVDFDWARTPEERNRLWTARHKAYFAGLQLRPGCRSITTDVCVPISRLAECIEQTRADLERASFPSTLIGHVGDGNFHVQMLIDPQSQPERDEAEGAQRAHGAARPVDGRHLQRRTWGGHAQDRLPGGRTRRRRRSR
jgi:D-lactate dehydrogenase (cytochrome)